MANVDVDRPRLAVVGAAVQLVQERLPCVDAAGVGGQKAQQLELEGRELDRVPVQLDRVLGNVDDELARLDQLFLASVENGFVM